MVSQTSKFYTAIPDPTPDVNSIREAITAIKATIEVMTHQRKPFNGAVITYQDLIDLGLLNTSGNTIQDNGGLLADSATLFGTSTPAQISAAIPLANGALQAANNLSDVAAAATARTNLGLGTAATQTVGVAANNVVQLNGTSQLPAVDGSLLTGIAQAGRLIAGTALVLNPYATGGTTTQAHGLGVVPTVLTYIFECLTADQGYSVGDKLWLPLYTAYGNVIVDATNLVLVRSNGSFTVINKTTFNSSIITNANWKLTITPYKLT